MFRIRKAVPTEIEPMDPVESTFDTMMGLIKNLPRADYNRLKKAMDLGYEAYQKVRGIKTDGDDEIVINNAEFMLTQEEK